MKPFVFAILLGLLILLLFDNIVSGSEVSIITKEEVFTVEVEVADDSNERSEGLMDRGSLGKNRGMVFVFDEVGKHQFWMKNTKIPLDMIFISPSFKIVEILTAEPCEEDPCQRYGSSEEVLYVLEVNSGYAERHGIEEGDGVNIYL